MTDPSLWPILRDAAKRPLLRMTPMRGRLCAPLGRLLWKAACLRGAPSALAARLPPEFRLGARPGPPIFIPRIIRVSAPVEPNQSIHVRKAAKVRRYRLFQNPVPAADGIPDARRPAAARAGNPGALEPDRPLRAAARERGRPL